jgi:hypothetical protein
MYWLTYGGSPGRRMPARDGTPQGTAPVPVSFGVAERTEENLLYSSNIPWEADHDHWFWDYTLHYPVGDGTAGTLTTSLGTLTPTRGATAAGIVTATLHGDGLAGRGPATLPGR